MKSNSDARAEYIARTREAREFAQKTHQETADAVGIDRATYTNYELRRAMPQKHIAKFCKFTGVEADWLLTGDGPMVRDGVVSDSQLINKIRSLNEKQQQAFEAMLDTMIKTDKGK